MPPDLDIDPDDGDEEAEDEEKTDFIKLWAMAVRCGIPDSEWQNLTIPKIRALGKAKRKEEEFQVNIHGGEIKNKKAKKAKFLSDLGYYPKQ